MGLIDRRTWLGLALFAAGGLAVAAAADDDPLVAGSKWKGKVTQKGKIRGDEMPLDLDATLTVTKRDGVAFEAELAEQVGEGNRIKLTYLVKGEVKATADGTGVAVEFKSYKFKDDPKGETFLNIPYTGTAAGKTLKGTWKHPPNDDDTTLEGEFSLELTK